MTLDTHEFEQADKEFSGEEFQDFDESLSDADLETLLKGDEEDQDGRDDKKQEHNDNSGDDAKGQKGDKADEEQPPTIESLQSELAKQKQQLEQATRERTHYQQVVSRHSQELGDLRRMRQVVLDKIAARKQIDPTEQMIADPDGFQQRAIDEASDQRELQDLERHEQHIQAQATVDNTRHQVHRMVSQMGITPEEFETDENLDAICHAMTEAGEHPQNIAAYRQSPYLAPAAVTYAYYQATRLKAKDNEIAELKQQLETAKQQPTNMLQRIEREARRKPMPNSGGKVSVKGSGVDVSQLTEISDAELEELAKQLK